MKRRYMALLCMMAVLLSAVTGCGKKEQQIQAVSDQAETETAETETETDINPIELIRKENYDGYIFKIGSFINGTWPKPEFLAEEMTGDVLNDALYMRNTVVEGLLNIKINTTESGDITSGAKKTILAGDEAYDLMSNRSGHSMQMALDGMLFNMLQLSDVDFKTPWWYSDYILTSSFQNRIYFALSSCNLYGFDTTPIVLFSKDLINEYSLDMPYTYVYNNTWTMDVMQKMAEGISVDVDGNGEMDLNDKYGIVGNNYISDVFLYGCNIFFVEKDENDLPYFTVNMDHLSEIMDTMLSLTNRNHAYVADRYNGVDREAAPLNAFTEKRALFWPSPISALFKIRDAEIEYGVLPVPMLNTEQGRYTSFITTAGTVLSLPSTCSDMDRSGNITEALAAASYIYVKPAYYDVTLTSKLSQDEDSSKMLDIIQSSYVCDLGNLLRDSGLSFVDDLRSVITKEEANLASLYASKEKTYHSVIDKTIEKISNFS